MAPLLVDPCDYLKPHHSVGHCPRVGTSIMRMAQQHPWIGRSLVGVQQAAARPLQPHGDDHRHDSRAEPQRVAIISGWPSRIDI